MYCFYCCNKRGTESNVNDNSVDINASLLKVSVNRYLELMEMSNHNNKLLTFLKKNGHDLHDPNINNFIVKLICFKQTFFRELLDNEKNFIQWVNH